MINGLPMPDAVTVLVSTELLAQLEQDWSAPVQIQIVRTPGIGSGYEMTARTHTCPGPEVVQQALDRWLRERVDTAIAHHAATTGNGHQPEDHCESWYALQDCLTLMHDESHRFARTHTCQPSYPYPVVCRKCSGYGVLPDSGAPDDDTPKLCPACTVQPDGGATHG